MRQAHPIPNNLERLSYCFDKFANLAARKDIKAKMEESFTYEGMEVTYTGFDKVSRVRQGGDSLRYVYGFDRERIRMEEFRPEETRTKDYVGSCEFITKTALGESTTRTLTFVSGPCGVFAVVEREGGAERTHYVHKDHLGSWTVITDEDGEVEQTLSYDAWGCLRDPASWANHSAPGDFEPMFGRGFTGHEHLSRFGLVNMNGRMYDPFTASFLSADRFVQDPSSAQGFNRYAYCMHNPLRYVDPSGWRHWQPAPGSTPSAGDHFRDIYAYSERAYEPGDFRNAYYLCNMAFYENIKGPGGGSGNNLGYIGSYGYYATHQANSVYNPTSLMNILQDWQNHPSYITNKNLQDMGVSDMTAGELYGSYNGSPGYRNTYYTWTDSEGNPHHAEVLYEYVGGNRNGVYAVSNQPLWMYDARSLLENSVILAQSLGIPLGTITEGVEMAAKSYHHVPLLKIRSGLTHAQKVAALSKEGVALLKASKGIGIVGASFSVGINLYQTIDYGLKGGTDVNVYAKTSLDIVMTGVSFLGPIGLAAGTTYFIVDLATDSFGGWGKIP